MNFKRFLSACTAALFLSGAVFSTAAAEPTKENAAPAETVQPISFTDTAGHWAETAIKRWSGEGIIVGESDGRFRPDDPLTRAEMAIILQRVMRYETVSENLFADLREEWYINAIQSLRAAGVMRGDEKNCANPYDPITREEAVTLIARAFLMEASDSPMSFPDAGMISDWARGYVAALTEAGFLRGSDGGNFLPANPMTRAEVVTILNNMITACFYAEGEYDFRPFEGLANFVIVGADNVKIKNFDIGGTILLAEGVDYESVIFSMVNHYGNVMQYTPEGYVRRLKAASYIVPINPELPLCSYDPALFVKDEKGIMHYNDPARKSYMGIDVSNWQGTIDWKKVKEEGVYFAFIRAGYRGYESGALNIDKNFEVNIKGALDAGIKVGVYFFSQALNAAEAYEEAEFVLDLIKDYNVTFPVVFDWETVSSASARTNEMETEDLCRAANVFCSTVKDAGYIPLVYSNQSLSLLKYDLSRVQSYDFWYAEYKDQPTFYYDFDIWQYTQEGKLAGVPESYVDLNISFVDYSKLKP